MVSFYTDMKTETTHTPSLLFMLCEITFFGFWIT